MPSKIPHAVTCYVNDWLRHRMPERAAYLFIDTPEFWKAVAAFANGKTIKLKIILLPNNQIDVQVWSEE
jgi:hypothetical protein